MRVVFDANVLVSFLLTGGETISLIIDLWKQKEFTLLISLPILGELKRTLKIFVQKGLIGEEESKELLWRLENEAEEVEIFSFVSMCSDPKDNRYLACALDGKADYLVTGDKKHLLPLKKIGKAQIISPKEFVKTLRA